MRISGNEPSSVIFSQTKWFQTLKMIARKCQIKLKPKWDGVNKPTKLQFQSILINTENFDALKHYESTEVDRRTWLHVPSRTPWSTSSDTHQVVGIWKAGNNDFKNIKSTCCNAKFNPRIRFAITVISDIYLSNEYKIQPLICQGIKSTKNHASLFC